MNELAATQGVRLLTGRRVFRHELHVGAGERFWGDRRRQDEIVGDREDCRELLEGDLAPFRARERGCVSDYTGSCAWDC